MKVNTFFTMPIKLFLNGGNEMEGIAIRQTKLKKLTITAVTMCFFSALFYCYEYYLRITPPSLNWPGAQATVGHHD